MVSDKFVPDRHTDYRQILSPKYIIQKYNLCDDYQSSLNKLQIKTSEYTICNGVQLWYFLQICT